jgi:hypothetical protein
MATCNVRKLKMRMMSQLQAFNERTFTLTLKNLEAGARTIYCAVYPTTDQIVSSHSSQEQLSIKQVASMSSVMTFGGESSNA